MKVSSRVSENDILRQQTISGIGWISVAQVGKQGIQFIISIILARLLTPKDFGLIGMILVFTGFVNLVGELGFGAALIQRHMLEEKHYSSIFWLNAVTGLAFTGLFTLIAPLIANFYDEPQLVSLTRLIVINFAISSFGTVQNAMLNRTMKFRWLAFIEITAVLVAGGLATILALMGYGIWSLAWQILITSITTTLGLWFVTGWRPHLSFDWNAVKDLVGFSSNLLGFNIFNYWARNADNLLIGKFMGTAELGIYTRAYSTMLLPLSQVTSVFGRVMFPTLSKVQSDIVLVKQIYLRSLELIALVTFPMMMGLLVLAKHFVLTLYGPKWEMVTSLLQILSLVGMIQSLVATVGWIYQSQGRTDWMFKWGLFVGFSGVTSFLIGLQIGTVEAVAICYGIVNVLLLYWNFTIPGKLIQLTFVEVLHTIIGTLGCAIGMALAVWALGLLLPTNWPHWAYLIIQAVYGLAVYILLIHTFKIHAYYEARTLLTEQWRKKGINFG